MATSIGIRARASRSMIGSGSGRKMAIARRSSRPSGASTVRSTRFRPPMPATTSTPVAAPMTVKASAQSDGSDQERHQQRAERHRRDQRALHRPEHAAHDRVGHCALHDRVGVDVDERVAEADQHHRQRGNARRSARRRSASSGSDQSRTPTPKSSASRPALREDERDQPADETTDADDGVEVADARRPDVEQVEGDRDDEDGRRARRRRTARRRGRSGGEGCGRRGSRGSRRSRAGRTPRPPAPLVSPVLPPSPTGARARTAPTRERRSPLTTKTVWMSVTASRMPPSAGPAKNPTLSIVLAATFAAVSSPRISRERRAAGRPERGGSTSPRRTSRSRAHTRATGGPSTAITTAPVEGERRANEVGQRASRSLREWRSASVDASGNATAIDR